MITIVANLFFLIHMRSVTGIASGFDSRGADIASQLESESERARRVNTRNLRVYCSGSSGFSPKCEEGPYVVLTFLLST